MKKVIFASAICMGLAITACNSDNKADNPPGNGADTVKMTAEDMQQKVDSSDINKDMDFATAAAQGGMMEVKVSQLAKTNASAAAVKEFAGMMIKDHGAANDEFKALAAKENITLPTGISADQQKKYDDIAAKKGADFDKAYMALMLDDHKATIAKFDAESTSGKNAAVKAWAAGKLATLNHHLDMAKSANDAVNK